MSAPPWSQLHGGTPIDLLAPEPAQIVVPDLIRSICRLPRYLAHTMGDEPWTVGEHSLLVADILTQDGAPHAVVREGLLHDLAEGIYGDWPSPVSSAIRQIHREQHPDGLDPLTVLKRRIDAVVRRVLDLPEHEHPLVRRADLIALAIERRDLMASCERDWSLPEYARQWAQLRPSAYHNLVERQFHERLTQLEAR